MQMVMRSGRMKGGNMFTRELSGITLINGGEGEPDSQWQLQKNTITITINTIIMTMNTIAIIMNTVIIISMVISITNILPSPKMSW